MMSNDPAIGAGMLIKQIWCSFLIRSLLDHSLELTCSVLGSHSSLFRAHVLVQLCLCSGACTMVPVQCCQHLYVHVLLLVSVHVLSVSVHVLSVSVHVLLSVSVHAVTTHTSPLSSRLHHHSQVRSESRHTQKVPPKEETDQV